MSQSHMPLTISGQSTNGDIEESMELVLESDSDYRPSQATYICRKDNSRWFVKGEPSNTVIREACGANYFRFLLGDEFSPETRLINDKGRHFVISRFIDNLSELKAELDPTGIPSILLACFVIDDRDSQKKNFFIVDQHGFRIDFGASMLNPGGDHNLRIPFITSMQDLRVGFNGNEFIQRLKREDFINFIHQLSRIDITKFPWDKWLVLYGNNHNELLEQKQLLEERTQLLCRAFLNHNATLENPETVDPILYKKLISYYQIASREKDKSDLLLIPITPEILAIRHLNFLNQHKRHPDFFIKSLDSCYEIVDTKQPSTEFSDYVSHNFRADEFGLKRDKHIVNINYDVVIKSFSSEKMLRYVKALQIEVCEDSKRDQWSQQGIGLFSKKTPDIICKLQNEFKQSNIEVIQQNYDSLKSFTSTLVQHLIRSQGSSSKRSASTQVFYDKQLEAGLEALGMDKEQFTMQLKSGPSSSR